MRRWKPLWAKKSSIRRLLGKCSQSCGSRPLSCSYQERILLPFHPFGSGAWVVCSNARYVFLFVCSSFFFLGKCEDNNDWVLLLLFDHALCFFCRYIEQKKIIEKTTRLHCKGLKGKMKETAYVYLFIITTKFVSLQKSWAIQLNPHME